MVFWGRACRCSFWCITDAFAALLMCARVVEWRQRRGLGSNSIEILHSLATSPRSHVDDADQCPRGNHGGNPHVHPISSIDPDTTSLALLRHPLVTRSGGIGHVPATLSIPLPRCYRRRCRGSPSCVLRLPHKPRRCHCASRHASVSATTVTGEREIAEGKEGGLHRDHAPESSRPQNSIQNSVVTGSMISTLCQT